MSENTKTARGKATVPGGRYTNHVDHRLSETDRKLAVYELQRERSDVYTALIKDTTHEAKRQIIVGLYLNDGVSTYNDLDGCVSRHKSNIKKHVADLHDKGIVNRSGNPAIVSFTDTDVALLATDVLNITDPLR